jgi:hypothetical protein
LKKNEHLKVAMYVNCGCGVLGNNEVKVDGEGAYMLLFQTR